MKFTDICIERPVLAIVISLLILVLGLRSMLSLPIQEYPSVASSVITVSTAYTGADPNTIAGFITTPLEGAIAQANGIDYMTSSSTQGFSTISANLLLNYDANKALTEVNTQVNSVLNQLPKASQLPSISITTGQTIDSMYLGFYSNVIASNKTTDYLIRVVQPQLQAVNGVLNAEILGGRQFAIRVWLDPVKLAGFNVSAAEVANVLSQNNFVTAAGRTDGSMFTLNLTANTSLTSVDDFKRLIVRADSNTIIHLGDIANVTLGAQNYDTAVKFDGQEAVYIGIQVTPNANLLTVIDNVKRKFAEIQSELPEGLEGKIVYDATNYVTASISEVVHSLVEAFIIVSIVVFLFLGSFRSLVIPLIAIPLSLIGTFFIMLLLGYTINLLTLLAFVLAIGLVVDDAIIVVENVHRHMEQGTHPFKAAILSARELTSPIIAISVVLIAVYLPIGFMSGLTGALFTEFAFTLAAAVGVSAVIALTLSPMMCSKFLVHHAKTEKKTFSDRVDEVFDRVKKSYENVLHHALNFLTVVGVFAVIILLSNYFLFITADAELAPQEDQGIILAQLSTAANSSRYQTNLYSEQVFDIFNDHPEYDHSFQIIGAGGAGGGASLNASINGMILKPWDKRKKTSNELQPIIQKQLNDIAGAKTASFQLPSLPGGGSGLPVQFVLQSTAHFSQMNEVVKPFVQKAVETGLFMYIDPDLKIDKKQTTVQINKDRVAELGLNMQDIGNIITASLSEGYINYFNYMGRSYQVIPQMQRVDRWNDSDLLHYYFTTRDGKSLPFSTIASLKREVVPESINHFQQLNSATISAVPAPGISLGDALSAMQKIAQEHLPAGYSIDYAAQSRQYIQEGAALVATFFFALIIIFLSLSAQFNSFRDPLIVLISVPMSICGAMIFICMGVGGATLNIYSEVGLVTLIGLISKHGILIVQFANDQQKEGKSKREAIELAASIRLRPILMTTAAMVLGVIPLITASGAGAVSRFNIGLVIASGISIGTMFTLFVVPAMYMFLAEDHQKRTNESRELGDQIA